MKLRFEDSAFEYKVFLVAISASINLPDFLSMSILSSHFYKTDKKDLNVTFHAFLKLLIVNLP